MSQEKGYVANGCKKSGSKNSPRFRKNPVSPIHRLEKIDTCHRAARKRISAGVQLLKVQLHKTTQNSQDYKNLNFMSYFKKVSVSVSINLVPKNVSVSKKLVLKKS